MELDFYSTEDLWRTTEGHHEPIFPDKDQLRAEFSAFVLKLEGCFYTLLKKKPNIVIEDMKAFLASGRSTFRQMIRNECEKQHVDLTEPGTSEIVSFLTFQKFKIHENRISTKNRKYSALLGKIP